MVDFTSYDFMAAALTAFLLCDGSIGVQVAGIAAWTCLWYFVLPLIAAFIREGVVKKHPMCQNWITLNRKCLKKSFMVDFDDHSAFMFASELTAAMFQHFGRLILFTILILIYLSSISGWPVVFTSVPRASALQFRCSSGNGLPRSSL